MKSFLAHATAAILAGGILTCWVRDLWAVAAFQIAIFSVAIVWMVSAWKSGKLEIHWGLAPVFVIPAIGMIQFLFGGTVNRWETLRETLVWLASGVMMLLVLQFGKSHRLRERWLSILVVFATLVSVLGVIQNFLKPGMIFGIFDSGYPDLVLGPFVYHNKFAQFLELFLAIAMYRALTRRGETAIWLLCAAAMLGGIVASASRSGFAFGVLEIVAFLVILSRFLRTSQRQVIRVASQTALLALIAAGVVGWDYLAGRFQLDPLSDFRIPIMQGSAGMVQARPWMGFGLGSWDKAYPQFALFDNGLYVNQAHCDWLQWPAEGGVVMLAMMIWLAAISVRLAVRHPWVLGVPIVLLHGAVDYPMHQVPQFATMVLAVLAAGMAESRAGEQAFRVRE